MSNTIEIGRVTATLKDNDNIISDFTIINEDGETESILKAHIKDSREFKIVNGAELIIKLVSDSDIIELPISVNITMENSDEFIIQYMERFGSIHIGSFMERCKFSKLPIPRPKIAPVYMSMAMAAEVGGKPEAINDVPLKFIRSIMALNHPAMLEWFSAEIIEVPLKDIPSDYRAVSKSVMLKVLDVKTNKKKLANKTDEHGNKLYYYDKFIPTLLESFMARKFFKAIDTIVTLQFGKLKRKLSDQELIDYPLKEGNLIQRPYQVDYLVKIGAIDESVY